MNTVINSANGLSKKALAATIKEDAHEIPPVKFEKPEGEKPKEQKVEEPKLQNLEDRLHRLNILFDLQKKHARLQESKTKLDSFVTNQNRENSELELTDDEGNDFKTTNPAVIQAVVDMIKKTIAEKSEEIANQITL